MIPPNRLWFFDALEVPWPEQRPRWRAFFSTFAGTTLRKLWPGPFQGAWWTQTWSTQDKK